MQSITEAERAFSTDDAQVKRFRAHFAKIEAKLSQIDETEDFPLKHDWLNT